MYDTAIYSPLEKDFNYAFLIELGLKNLNKKAFIDYNKYLPDSDPEIYLDRIRSIGNVTLIISKESCQIFSNKDSFDYKLLIALIQENKKIIPIVFDDSKFTLSKQVPKEIAHIFRFNAIFYSHEDFQQVIKKLIKYILNYSLDGSKKPTVDISELTREGIHKVNRLITFIVKYESIFDTTKNVGYGLFIAFMLAYGGLAPETSEDHITYFIVATALYLGLIKPVSFFSKLKFKKQLKSEALSPQEALALADQINNKLDLKKKDSPFLKEIKLIIFTSI